MCIQSGDKEGMKTKESPKHKTQRYPSIPHRHWGAGLLENHFRVLGHVHLEVGGRSKLIQTLRAMVGYIMVVEHGPLVHPK